MENYIRQNPEDNKTIIDRFSILFHFLAVNNITPVRDADQLYLKGDNNENHGTCGSGP